MALGAVLRISIAAVLEVCGVQPSVGPLRKSACVSGDCDDCLLAGHNFLTATTAAVRASDVMEHRRADESSYRDRSSIAFAKLSRLRLASCLNRARVSESLSASVI
jgi:hypothetical protein